MSREVSWSRRGWLGRAGQAEGQEMGGNPCFGCRGNGISPGKRWVFVATAEGQYLEEREKCRQRGPLAINSYCYLC
jgi:hypothetical protein